MQTVLLNECIVKIYMRVAELFQPEFEVVKVFLFL